VVVVVVVVVVVMVVTVVVGVVVAVVAVVVVVMMVVVLVVMMVKGRIEVAQALNRLRRGTAMIVRRLLVEKRRGRHHCLAMKRARIREENEELGERCDIGDRKAATRVIVRGGGRGPFS
jgi:ABC-type transport system involved in cytochrome bd biosynthesis fused ATPase/permease subunit